MAATAISGLTALTAPAVADELIVVDDSAGDNKSLALSYLARDTGGTGAIVTGAYTLTLPATGTAALLGTAQTFSAAQTIATLVGATIKPASDSTTALKLANAAGTAVVTVDTTNKYLGIGTTPAYPLHVVTTTGTTTTPATYVGGSGTVQFWKDNPLTRGAAIGLGLPGVTAGDDLRLSSYNGTSWATHVYITNVAGNVKVAGTATRATTEGTNHLDIFNGTAPVGTLTNGISIYSSSGNGHMMDAAGNSGMIVTAANATKTTGGAPYTNDGYITVVIGGTSVRLMTTA